MSEVVLSKTFRFESAHRLGKGYDGACANIHGHSFNGDIQVACSTLDRFDMGVDFSEIKKFIKIVEDQFDHKLLVYKEDRDLIRFCEASGLAVFVFEDGNPTSEVIARHIFNQAEAYFRALNPEIKVSQITVEETCTSRCVWRAT